MRILIQRVTKARVTPKDSENTTVKIGKGLVCLTGFEESDSPVIIDQMIQKMKALRIFSDEKGKLNLAASEVGGEYLLVSQFTLYAECKYGNRPSFDGAAGKARAKESYEYFVQSAERILGPPLVKHSEFGSDIVVDISNDGPVTIWLDSKTLL